jgi:hypothetical protein
MMAPFVGAFESCLINNNQSGARVGNARSEQIFVWDFSQKQRTIELMLTGADEYRFLWKDVLLIKDPR